MILLGSIRPLLMYGGTVAYSSASLLGTLGLKIAFKNLDVIPTSPVDLTKVFEARIPGTADVIVVNSPHQMVRMPPVQPKQECWLTDQLLLNPNCQLKISEIPYATDSIIPNFKYDDLVNMQDVTGLNRVNFTDKFDLGKN